jgi:uncharacterized protein YraI
MFVLRTALAAIALAALATTPTLADRPTARASGVQAIHTAPRSSSPLVGKLADQERVYLDRCTRQARWCHIIQLDGGPGGWVLGSYLIGSPAKVMVTPFEFSFDPMHPLGGRPGHEDHWPFD